MLVLRANVGAVPRTVITNTVSVTSGASDPNPANNTASAATAVIPAPLRIVTGVQDQGARVRVFTPVTLADAFDILAFEPGFAGEVRVATGDVNGDAVADFVAGAGPGGGPHVEAFSGQTGAVLLSFLAFPAAGRDGLYVGAGDLDGDGFAEIVTGLANGTTEVRVFDHAGQPRADFRAYEPQFLGGVRVGVVDHGGGGLQDVVTGVGAGGSAHVKVFDGVSFVERSSFLADAQPLTTGVYVG